jgi:hypothetical protein
MVRIASTLLVFATLSAWAGAQGPTGIPAADRLKLLRANRQLIENMVDNGIDLARADTPLRRADVCYRTTRSLSEAMQAAAGEQNLDRVAELCGHLDAVVRDALAPNLADASRTIPPGSPDESELKKLRATALKDFDDLSRALPVGGKVGGDARVRDVVGKLESLRDKLK